MSVGVLFNNVLSDRPIAAVAPQHFFSDVPTLRRGTCAWECANVHLSCALSPINTLSIQTISRQDEWQRLRHEDASWMNAALPRHVSYGP